MRHPEIIYEYTGISEVSLNRPLRLLWKENRRGNRDARHLALLGDKVNDESLSMATELVEVRLAQDDLAAVDGWRQTNGLISREDALRQLIRLGLLSEVGRIFRGVSRS